MDMSPIAVDVDGSFANPVMQVSVIAWGVVLGVFLTVAFAFLKSRLQRIACATGVIAFGCVFSPFVNRLVAMWLYAATSKPGVGAGIIGGPPFWLSPLFGLAFAGIGALIIGRGSLVRAGV